MSDNTLPYNKRVLYAGLTRMTNDRAMIQKAYLHWLDNFSGQPFDVANVVEQLVSYLGLDINEKKALMIAMHAASTKLYDDLAPVPQVMEDSSAGNAAVKEDVGDFKTGLGIMSSAHAQITTEYLQLLIKHIEKQSGGAINEIKNILLNEEMPELSKELVSTVTSWADNGLRYISLPDDVSVNDCTDLAHQVYLVVCDVIGPIQADEIMNKAVVDAQKLDAAAQFNPRELL